MQSESQNKLHIVHEAIEKRILNGVWSIGCQMPTEAEFAAEFKCSRSTIGKAVARLTHDGLVERRTRAGTRVIRNRPVHETLRPQLDAVAFVFPTEQHEGIWRTVQGFQGAAHTAQRRTVMLTTGTNFQKEAEIIGRLDEFDVKGAVVCPVLPEPKDCLYFAQMLLACRFPVILADIALPSSGRPAVIMDGFHAGHMMTRHLLAQGLQRIGFLSSYAWVPSARDCYLGYGRALEEAGIEEQPGWALLEPSMHPDFEHPVEGSHPFTRRFLEKVRDVEGVVCSGDFLALSCLASARELGVRVPEDLKVVGISDYVVSARSEPPLTTYHVPYEEMGRQAFQMLERLVQGEKLSKLEVKVRGGLVVRQSG